MEGKRFNPNGISKATLLTNYFISFTFSGTFLLTSFPRLHGLNNIPHFTKARIACDSLSLEISDFVSNCFAMLFQRLCRVWYGYSTLRIKSRKGIF